MRSASMTLYSVAIYFGLLLGDDDRWKITHARQDREGQLAVPLSDHTVRRDHQGLDQPPGEDSAEPGGLLLADLRQRSPVAPQQPANANLTHLGVLHVGILTE